MNIFPNAVYRFIYSNYDVLAAKQIAEYLGCSERDVKSVADDMGIPAFALPPLQRALPLIIRRNWTLIPKKDIASLIGVTGEELDRALVEMDFLDIKLGKQPAVKPIRWKKPTSRQRSAARKLKELFRPYLENSATWEEPFGFLKEISRIPADFSISRCRKPQELWNPFMLYSYVGTHGDFLLTGEDFFPEGVLARLAERGVNAVWIPALLRNLAPSKIFPEFGRAHKTRIRNLRRMARKALRFGIGIYLYLNEPRGMPSAFFKSHPDVRGMRSRVAAQDIWALCTSTHKVQDFLRESAAFIFARVPELAGAFLITASENVTNCYSHYSRDLPADAKPKPFCPRCKVRGAAQVLTDAARSISEGIKKAGSPADVIQWLWSWHYIVSRNETLEAIRLLPPAVSVMVDWARGTPFKRFGVKAVVDEYSIAFVKPSSLAKSIIRAARRQKRKVLARVQISTSVEMNPMPYLPVLPNTLALMRQMRKQGVEGFLGCWIFGAYPSRNAELVSLEKKDNPLDWLARKYYGKKGAPFALRAWKAFSKGLSYLPESQNVLYASPLNPGPGAQLAQKTEPETRMVLRLTKNLEAATYPFGPEICVKSFRYTAKYWQQGIAYLRKAVELSPEKYKRENQRDLGVSIGCGVHFRSAANHIEFLHLNDLINRKKKKLDKPGKRLLEIIDDETETVRALLAVAEIDSRIGFEGSAGYFYRPTELIEKLVGLQKLRRKIASKFKTAATGKERKSNER